MPMRSSPLGQRRPPRFPPHEFNASCSADRRRAARAAGAAAPARCDAGHRDRGRGRHDERCARAAGEGGLRPRVPRHPAARRHRLRLARQHQTGRANRVCHRLRSVRVACVRGERARLPAEAGLRTTISGDAATARGNARARGCARAGRGRAGPAAHDGRPRVREDGRHDALRAGALDLRDSLGGKLHGADSRERADAARAAHAEVVGGDVAGGALRAHPPTGAREPRAREEDRTRRRRRSGVSPRRAGVTAQCEPPCAGGAAEQVRRGGVGGIAAVGAGPPGPPGT
jgi:hypothetical protein